MSQVPSIRAPHNTLSGLPWYSLECRLGRCDSSAGRIALRAHRWPNLTERLVVEISASFRVFGLDRELTLFRERITFDGRVGVGVTYLHEVGEDEPVLPPVFLAQSTIE